MDSVAGDFRKFYETYQNICVTVSPLYMFHKNYFFSRKRRRQKKYEREKEKIALQKTK